MNNFTDLRRKMLDARIKVRQSLEEERCALQEPDWHIKSPGAKAAYDLNVAMDRLSTVFIDHELEGLYSPDGQEIIREAVRAYRANMQFVDDEKRVGLDFEDNIVTLLGLLVDQ